MNVASKVYETSGLAIVGATGHRVGPLVQGAFDECMYEAAARQIGGYWHEELKVWVVPSGRTFARADAYWKGEHDGKAVVYGPVEFSQAKDLAVECGQDTFIWNGSLYHVNDEGQVDYVQDPVGAFFDELARVQDGHTLFEDGSALSYQYHESATFHADQGSAN